MPTTTYEQIIRAVALRVQAIAGSSSAAVQSAYVTTPITTTQIDSPDFPLAPLQDACINAEEKLAHAIANAGNHPWRANLASVTGSLAHKAALPAVSTGSKPIIGIWGSVYDASSGIVCTEKPLEVIRRLVQNPGSFYVLSNYFFKIDGQRIYHTRTNVVIDCCIYSRSDQTTRIATVTNTILLPDVLEEAYVAGALSVLLRDDAFMPQAAIFRSYFNDTLAQIGQGLTSVPPKSIPGPVMTANQA